MFCNKDHVRVVTRDRILEDNVYQSPVDAHLDRFRTRLAWILLALAAGWMVLMLTD